MSLFGKLFGSGGKGGKSPTPQEAIQRLRETEEMLAKKQDFLEKKIEQELMTAKKNGTKNKRAALQALKRKKRYEKQLAQIDGTLSTIEFQREALENANTNTEVLKNMGFAAKAMKAAHENMDIDKVDDLMAEITEQQEVAQEISDVISRPVGFGEDYDEDELMAELEELEQEELDKNLLEIGGTEDVSLPSVPSTSLPARPAKKKVEEDEDDMADLEAWAANWASLPCWLASGLLLCSLCYHTDPRHLEETQGLWAAELPAGMLLCLKAYIPVANHTPTLKYALVHVSWLQKKWTRAFLFRLML